MRMLLGKFAGCPIEQLPSDYLKWLGTLCLSNANLREAVARELELRSRSRATFCESAVDDDCILLQIPAEDAEPLLDLINAGYRALSCRMHPGQGEDGQQQQRLNVLVGALRKLLQEALQRAELASA